MSSGATPEAAVKVLPTPLPPPPAPVLLSLRSAQASSLPPRSLVSPGKPLHQTGAWATRLGLRAASPVSVCFGVILGRRTESHEEPARWKVENYFWTTLSCCLWSSRRPISLPVCRPSTWPVLGVRSRGAPAGQSVITAEARCPSNLWAAHGDRHLLYNWDTSGWWP